MSAIYKPLAAILAIAPSFALAAPRPVPDSTLEMSTGGTQTASVVVSPSSGEYFGPITVDGKTYNVLYDTGSNALWIKGHGNGPKFSVTYGSGTVSGTVTQGDVTVGGVTIRNQSYGLVDQNDHSYDNYDGIIGLGLSQTQLTHQESSWIKNFMPLLKNQVFAVDLGRDEKGSITFGYDNATSGTGGSSNTLPVVSSGGHWDIAANLNGVDQTLNCDLDTGTTDVILPTNALNAYWHGVRGAKPSNDGQSYTFPCDAQLPDFDVDSNGKKLAIEGKYTAFTGQGTCSSRIKGESGNGCILGQPIFYSNYIVYDYANKQVSLVPKA